MSPAPWKVVRGLNANLTERTLDGKDVIQDENGHAVARMMASDDPDSSMIAAAPELRECLAELLGEKVTEGGIRRAQMLLRRLQAEDDKT